MENLIFISYFIINIIAIIVFINSLFTAYYERSSIILKKRINKLFTAMILSFSVSVIFSYVFHDLSFSSNLKMAALIPAPMAVVFYILNRIFRFIGLTKSQRKSNNKNNILVIKKFGIILVLPFLAIIDIFSGSRRESNPDMFIKHHSKGDNVGDHFPNIMGR